MTGCPRLLEQFLIRLSLWKGHLVFKDNFVPFCTYPIQYSIRPCYSLSMLKLHYLYEPFLILSLPCLFNIFILFIAVWPLSCHILSIDFDQYNELHCYLDDLFITLTILRHRPLHHIYDCFLYWRVVPILTIRYYPDGFSLFWKFVVITTVVILTLIRFLTISCFFDNLSLSWRFGVILTIRRYLDDSSSHWQLVILPGDNGRTSN